ncbi:MAG TPA: DUF4010 domain-containing protein [Stellaceae bacterium]|nr:DUF4010 domain-containing protein [Stellaceae bacterium]
MATLPPIGGFLLLLGLGFFFGLAFEEFYGHGGQARPGGVRTFPLLALAGGLLYRLDTQHLLPLTVGLLVLGLWLTCYYWRHVEEVDREGRPNVGLMVPICNVLAYLLGPIALAEPPWMAIGVAVAAVLLLTAREKLHGFARRIETAEIITAGKFLVLTGLILPFLPSEPVTDLTEITPYQVWLAVLAVTTVSYASYLLQRYVAPPRGGLWLAVLGGLYSSTATTVVLARRASTDTEPAAVRQAQTGIMLTTAIMYLRVLIIVGVFNLPLAGSLAPALLVLAILGLGCAGLWYRARATPIEPEAVATSPANPLELTAAFIFAVLFVVISLVSTWARGQFGERGIFGLAAIVGATDIDPFVVNIAAGGATPLVANAGVAAILIAASSNNLVKAAFTVAFAGGRTAAAPAAVLVLLALGGIAAAWWIALR